MIRTALFAPLNYDHPQTGMERAFRGLLGDSNVTTFDYLELQRRGLSDDRINDGLYDEVVARKPDLVWLHLQETGVIRPQVLLDLQQAVPRTLLVHWTGDMRKQITPYLQGICQTTHLTLASSKGQLVDFRSAGAPRAQYCQIGLDWDEDVMGLPEWEPPFRVPDVVFCGNYYGTTFEGTKDRELAVLDLRGNGIDVGIVGGGWPPEFPVVGTCKVKQQHHVWKRAKIALNVNHFNRVAGYYSDRQLIAMASGTPVVCKYVPGLEQEFTEGEHCLWYERDPQLIGLVKKLLSSASLREKIGQQGRAEVMRRHSWFSRLLDLMPSLEKLRKELL